MPPEPLRALFEELDPAWAEDLNMIIVNAIEGVFSRFSRGEIAVTEILPCLERTLIRLSQVVPHSVVTPKDVHSRPRPTSKRRRNPELARPTALT